MFAEPQATPYDVTFRLFGVPVRVHPMFWVVALILGRGTLEGDHPLGRAATWVAVCFVSILVHEFGHALTYRAFGSPARVRLYWFGGLAISDYAPSRPARRLMVSLAGPAAGFALAGVVYATDFATGWQMTALPYTGEAYGGLMWINIFWGLVNLLPVYPLDGGQACRELCRIARVRNFDVVALKVSVAAGAVAAGFALFSYLDARRGDFAVLPWWLHVAGSVYTAVLFGALAYQNYQALQASRSMGDPYDDWDQARRPWR